MLRSMIPELYAIKVGQWWSSRANALAALALLSLSLSSLFPLCHLLLIFISQVILAFIAQLILSFGISYADITYTYTKRLIP